MLYFSHVILILSFSSCVQIHLTMVRPRNSFARSKDDFKMKSDISFMAKSVRTRLPRSMSIGLKLSPVSVSSKTGDQLPRVKKLKSILDISSDYAESNYVRETVLKIRDEFRWFMPIASGNSKTLAQQQRLDCDRVNLFVTSAFDKLCEKVSFSQLQPISLEVEIWLASMVLKKLNESTRLKADKMIFVGNYIIAADKNVFKAIYTDSEVPFQQLVDKLTNDGAKDNEEKHLAPVFATRLAYVMTRPTNNGNRIIMVIPDHVTIDKKLYRHTYTAVVWVQDGILSVLLIDPLSVSISLEDYGLRLPLSLLRIFRRWGRPIFRIYRRYGNQKRNHYECLSRALIYSERLLYEPCYFEKLVNSCPAKAYLTHLKKPDIKTIGLTMIPSGQENTFFAIQTFDEKSTRKNFKWTVTFE